MELGKDVIGRTAPGIKFRWSCFNRRINYKALYLLKVWNGRGRLETCDWCSAGRGHAFPLLVSWLVNLKKKKQPHDLPVSAHINGPRALSLWCLSALIKRMCVLKGKRHIILEEWWAHWPLPPPPYASFTSHRRRYILIKQARSSEGRGPPCRSEAILASVDAQTNHFGCHIGSLFIPRVVRCVQLL